MDETQLASDIARRVVSDTQFWIAMIGLIGAVIGSGLTILGNVILHWLKRKPRRDLDDRRISMLREMLDDERFPDKWRNLSVLCAVVGASQEETKRLLFMAGARGSEKEDGKWGLIKNHPFPGPVH